MGGKNFQAGEAVERSFEDQVLQGNRGVERIADRIRQPAIALEARCKLRRALRMNEENRAKLFGLGPHRVKFLIGEVPSFHASADGGAAQALPLDRGLKLLYGQVRQPQR